MIKGLCFIVSAPIIGLNLNWAAFKAKSPMAKLVHFMKMAKAILLFYKAFLIRQKQSKILMRSYKRLGQKGVLWIQSMYSSTCIITPFLFLIMKAMAREKQWLITLSSATCEEMCHIRLSLKNFMPYGPRSSDRALISEEKRNVPIIIQTNYTILSNETCFVTLLQ